LNYILVIVYDGDVDEKFFFLLLLEHPKALGNELLVSAGALHRAGQPSAPFEMTSTIPCMGPCLYGKAC
jgi:hypothetical protein